MLPIIENTILNPVPGMEEAFIEGVELVKRNILEILHSCWRHAFFEFFAIKTQGKNLACNACKARGVADVAAEALSVFTQLPDLSSLFAKVCPTSRFLFSLFSFCFLFFIFFLLL